MPVERMSRLGRLDGAALVWISQYKEKGDIAIPTAWKGEGANPIVIFTGEKNDPHQYYFGGKGGRGTVNHGNMDGGSFIFELNGVRWVIDPGNQDYNTLEQTGFNLWGNCQNCERWSLLTKNNFGHSTLTVNNQHHVVNGLATIKNFKGGSAPEATIDMTAAFRGLLAKAERRFAKESERSLMIEDEIELTDSAEVITWQLMTQADVEYTDYGLNLLQEGKKLKVENLSHPGLRFSIVSLDPAPLKLDRQIKGLKRVELRIPAWMIQDNKEIIKIRLSEL